MSSPLATLLFTWAAVYSYVGAYNVMLYVRRPDHREYLAFGLMCFGLTVWSGGSAGLELGVLAPGAALQIMHVGGFAGVAYFTDFSFALAGRSWPRALRAAYVVCGVCIALVTAGVVVDRDRPVGLTPFGVVVSFAALSFAAWGIASIAAASRRRRDLRLVVFATMITFTASVHDVVVRATNAHEVFLLDHAGLAPVFAVSLLLLRRFVRSAGELGERTEELRRSYGELRVTQEELVRKQQLAAVGELSAVIAHEVRNPLAIIKNATSSLRRPTLAASDRGVLLGILDEEVDRLSRLVRDLLAYARPVLPEGRPVELYDVIEEAIGGALKNHADADTRIEVTVHEASAPLLYGDPDLLRQALTNIVDNAACAMPNGGRLTVRTREVMVEGRPHVGIDFEDTGEGMDGVTLSRAKDPFFTTRPAGTGLGLAIVERVIANHGGSITLESEAGAGTRVHVLLPREPEVRGISPAEVL